MNTYSLSDCQDLINKYINEYNGELQELEEGVLGLGTMLLHSAEGKKTILIKEVYLSAWSSGHTIRMYNKIPKKYERLIN